MQTTSVEFDPKNYLATERLINEHAFQIRSVRNDDKANLQDCLRHLSKRSRYLRFFAPKNEFTEKELAYFTELDFVRHVSLLATIETDSGESPIGVGEYIVSQDTSPVKTAEAAFAVEEEYQGLGVATALLKHLVRIALKDNIEEFTCLVLVENTKMIDVLVHSGLRIVRFEKEPGALNAHLRLAPRE